jgi:hypothetical protein
VVESGQGPQPFVGGLLLQAAARSAGAVFRSTTTVATVCNMKREGCTVMRSH